MSFILLGILNAQAGEVIKSVVTGGTLSTIGSYSYRAFTSSGTFTVADADLEIDVHIDVNKFIDTNAYLYVCIYKCVYIRIYR